MRSYVCVLFSVTMLACSSASTGGVQPTAETLGLGRVPDVPALACSETRGSVPLAPEATPTSCRTDDECTERRNGRCVRLSNHGPHGPSHEATMCSYDACFADSDCAPREACICAVRADTEPGTGHVCAGGECAADGDCGDGRYCRRGPHGRYCHAPSDECMEETDCGTGRRCARNPSTLRYECSSMTAIAPVG